MKYVFVDFTDESALLILAEAASQVSELKAGSKDTGTAATQDPDRDPDATPTGK